jgi:hypothetical protein
MERRACLSLMDQITQAANAELAKFLDALHRRFQAQFAYNLQVNIPNGIARPEDVPCDTVRGAIVSAINDCHQWSVTEALRHAAELLEDANVHDIAAVVYGALRQAETEYEKEGNQT